MTEPELELEQRTLHCVPGKSKIPATPISRDTGCKISGLFSFRIYRSQ